MTKPVDAETESAASDILGLKSKPEALEKFVATYIAEHQPAQVEKVRQYLESKGETAISKQFVPEAKISATHIDLGPADSKVSVAEFKDRAQKDIDDFKKDLTAKSASIVTVEDEKRNFSGVFEGKFHTEITGKAKVDFDGGKIDLTDSSSGIKYKFDICSRVDKTMTVTYPDGVVRTIQGRGEPDFARATFAAKTAEGFVGCSSDKAGILIALPNKVLDIDTRPRHLLPGKDMQTDAIETRPPRMYEDKRHESLKENYSENGQKIDQLILEAKEVESITNKANQMIAEYKELIEKKEAAPVVVEDPAAAFGYFSGKLHSEIPGKIKVDNDGHMLVVDDLASGTKYKFVPYAPGKKEALTITYPDGSENTFAGNIQQTRGTYFDFSAKTPDGNLGFAKNETAILVALPDKVLDIRWQARHLTPPKHLHMDPIEVSPPRMFLDKRGPSLDIEKYDSRGMWLEHDFGSLNQSE